ncbi:MAG: hypothetical protein ACLT1J_00980 [Mediterraneibacter gnavus]
MSKLNYKTKSDGQLIQKSKYYNVKSFYKDSRINGYVSSIESKCV